MEYVYIAAFLGLNLIWLFLIVFGLPGNWLMVASAAGLLWWKPELDLFNSSTLCVCAGLALVGEIFEFVSGVVGSKKAGGSKWGSVGAIVGALVGAIFGTVLIPIPIVGSILGVCLGAFAGAMLLELVSGRNFGSSFRSGSGAAVGRFVGVMAKLGVGAVIWIVLAAAAFLT
ncbi:MAG: DUF456 domain-containing protein [Planctomycetes bacterium]|nr:DUF456 domain-containing protein [Planctomycetota bacterium]